MTACSAGMPAPGSSKQSVLDMAGWQSPSSCRPVSRRDFAKHHYVPLACRRFCFFFLFPPFFVCGVLVGCPSWVGENKGNQRDERLFLPFFSTLTSPCVGSESAVVATIILLAHKEMHTRVQEFSYGHGVFEQSRLLAGRQSNRTPFRMPIFPRDDFVVKAKQKPCLQICCQQW